MLISPPIPFPKPFFCFNSFSNAAGATRSENTVCKLPAWQIFCGVSLKKEATTQRYFRGAFAV
jgi:hypothetical protein